MSTNAEQRLQQQCDELLVRLSAMTQRAEAAEARIKASQEQEPVLFGFFNVLTNSYYGLSNRGGAGQTAFYLAPVIPPDVAELQRKNAELTRKLAEQQAGIDFLIHSLEINERAGYTTKVQTFVLDVLRLHKGKEELTKLLAEAKNKAVPEDWQLVPKEPTRELLGVIVYDDYPSDWEKGKTAQMQFGSDVIPYKTEFEIAYGQYKRLLSAAPQPVIDIDQSPKGD